MIVCLEGLDGCGKSTQARLLAERLRARRWKFPDRSTPTGQLLYAHLERHLRVDWQVPIDRHGDLSSDKVAALMERHDAFRSAVPEADALVFQALQLANRMEAAGAIFDAAARGNVVFDRYWPSGYAYGKADGLDGEYLIGLHQWLPQPDLFLLLEVPADAAAERLAARGGADRYEADLPKLRQVAACYRELWLSMARQRPDRWRVLDAAGPAEDVAASVEQAVADFRGGA